MVLAVPTWAMDIASPLFIGRASRIAETTKENKIVKKIKERNRKVKRKKKDYRRALVSLRQQSVRRLPTTQEMRIIHITFHWV